MVNGQAVGNEQVKLGQQSRIRRHVAGLACVDADVGTALDALWSDIAGSDARVYVFVNGYSATLRKDDPSYGSLLEDDRVVPLADGVPLVIGSFLTGQGLISRCPGPDFFEAASGRASEDGTTFFLLGGGVGVVERLTQALEQRFPGLRILGAVTPPFGEWDQDESSRMCELIRDSGASVVWLGVSAPKQEVWSRLHLDEIGRPVVCVGAAFDFLSGAKSRAPGWMRKLGMEWLHRLLTEPRRLWRRYLVGNTVFLADLLRHRGSRTAAAGGRGVDNA